MYVIYLFKAIIPSCASGKYCGTIDTCLNSCPAEDTSLTCSSFISDLSACNSYSSGSGK